MTIEAEDVRYEMLDHVDENEYLMEEEFSDETLNRAIEKCVDDWNARAPDHRQKTLDSFPDKYKSEWVDGAIGHALRMKARALIRNDVPGGSGGVEFRDKARGKSYIELGNALVKGWRAKVSYWLNVEGILHGISSI